MVVDPKVFDTLFADVKSYVETFKSSGFDMAALTGLVRYAMSIVETGIAFKDMTGLECKDYVVAVVTDVVNDLLDDPDVGGKMPAEAVTSLRVGITMVPMIIDAAVGFAKTYQAAHPPALTNGDDGVATKSGCFCG